MKTVQGADAPTLAEQFAAQQAELEAATAHLRADVWLPTVVPMDFEPFDPRRSATPKTPAEARTLLHQLRRLHLDGEAA